MSFRVFVAVVLFTQGCVRRCTTGVIKRSESSALRPGRRRGAARTLTMLPTITPLSTSGHVVQSRIRRWKNWPTTPVRRSMMAIQNSSMPEVYSRLDGESDILRRTRARAIDGRMLAERRTRFGSSRVSEYVCVGVAIPSECSGATSPNGPARSFQGVCSSYS